MRLDIRQTGWCHLRVIGVRRLSPDDWRDWRRLRLAALADSPEAFSSKLSDWTADGDREDRWRSRLSSVPFNLLAVVDGAEVGMVSGARPAAEEAELLSLWVDAGARGRGVADTLVEEVLSWARQDGAVRVVLGVRAANRPAISLYRRHGFVDAGPNHDVVDGDRPERCMVRPLD